MRKSIDALMPASKLFGIMYQVYKLNSIQSFVQNNVSEQ